jgi:hypothetical protein
MPQYIHQLDIIAILKDLITFEQSLKDLFDQYDMNLRDNLGRRNALISSLQEKVTAKHLGSIFNDVISDGAPGKPDIQIYDIDRELECKITSGSRSKSYVSYALQTDYDTICKKTSLDYMYILCNNTFDKFCVLFFEDLTSEDFFPPATGSRGKSRMKKKNAMKKCIPLWGSYTIKNEELISRYEGRKKVHTTQLNESIGKILNKAFDDNICLKKVASMIENEEATHDKKIEKIDEKIQNWKEKDPQFSFVLKRLSKQGAN